MSEQKTMEQRILERYEATLKQMVERREEGEKSEDNPVPLTFWNAAMWADHALREGDMIRRLAKDNFDGFQVNRVIHITDPGYTRDTWCAGFGLKAKSGRGIGNVERGEIPGWGQRNLSMTVCHEDHEMDAFDEVLLDVDVGVDSGQCGVFNDDYPRGDDTGSFDDLESFYGYACALTIAQSYGYMKEGFVARSGIGDGSYEAYGARNGEGELVSVTIRFDNHALVKYEQQMPQIAIAEAARMLHQLHKHPLGEEE